MDDEKDTIGWGRGWYNNFTQVPNELFDEECTLTPIQFAVYLYLLSCVNVKRNGGCVSWPSYPTIAKKVRIGESTVPKALQVLIEKMYIFRKNRFAENGHSGQISNMYLINHPLETKDFR